MARDEFDQVLGLLVLMAVFAATLGRLHFSARRIG